MRTSLKIPLLFLVCIALGISLGAEGQKIATNSASQKRTPSQLAITATPDLTELPPLPQPEAATASATAALPAGDAPATKPKPAPEPFSCPKPEDPSEDDLSLDPVGPDSSIGDYVPPGLVNLDTYAAATHADICLEKPAARALMAMLESMHAAHMFPLVSSAYRDVNYQEHLRSTNTVTNGYSSVALPGHSEHQLGVAVDLIGVPDATSTDYLALNDFGMTLSYAWLTQHAAEYGFVQSYQAGNESITGYIAEPWHWRYVGIENAKAIVASGLAPVQYLENLKSQKATPATGTAKQ